MRLEPVILSIVLIFGLIFVPVSSLSVSENSDFYAGRVVAGKDLEEWAKEYWQWFISLPPPGQNEADGKCIIGQSSSNNIIFLINSIPLNYYNTQCEISNNPILVPLLISECDISVGEAGLETSNIREFWDCATGANNGTVGWQVTLDGRDLLKKASNIELINPDLEKQIKVTDSAFFNLTIPVTNRYDLQDPYRGITTPAVVAGHYLILNPLSPGEHTLSYNVDRLPPGVKSGPGNSETGKVTYNLIVK
jgi:hypothetical protein